jgi:Nuclear fragile X mental retardation-interacting protein 1 (NUFIP1)
MMQQQNQGQQYGWHGQAGGIPPLPPSQQQQHFQPPPPRRPAPPPPPHPESNGGNNWAPQVSLQPHHWQQQQQQQQQQQRQPSRINMFHHPGQQQMHNIGMNQYMQPTMMMHPGHFQHFQQQQQYQAVGGINNQGGSQQMRHNHHQRLGQPGNANNKRNNTSNNNRDATSASNNSNGGLKVGNTPAGAAERPSLTLPPSKRQRKKDIVPPLEKVTTEPTVREPINETERAEVEAWKAERRKHWPSVDNIARKEQADAARHARGELIGGEEESRKVRLQEILHKQKAMGLSKQAGTEDMLLRLNGTGSGRGRGGGGDGTSERGGGRGGRGRGLQGRGGGRGGRENTRSRGGRYGPEYGYQNFLDAGDAPTIDPGLEKWRQRQEERKNFENEEVGGQRDDVAAAVIDRDIKEVDAEQKDHLISTLNVAEEPVAGVQVDDEGDPHRQQQQQISSAGRGRGGGRDRGRGGRNAGGRGGRGRGRDNNGSHLSSHHRRPTQLLHAPPSLLEKLLAKEIRQDMSYILQAFRFFVMNNFFKDQNVEQQQAEEKQQLVFPAAAIEAFVTTADNATAIASGASGAYNIKPTIQDILNNKEGIDIDITDEEEEDEEEDLVVVKQGGEDQEASDGGV